MVHEGVIVISLLDDAYEAKVTVKDDYTDNGM